MADYFIQNAAVFNPSACQWSIQNILIQHGRISRMAPDLLPSENVSVIDASGKCLSAGWVDGHVHTYTSPGAIGLDCDSFLKQGVTYVVEAGTTGPGNFEDYLNNCRKGKKIRQKAYLNLASMGVLKQFGELTDLSAVDLDSCRQTVERYPEEIIGVKLRIDPRVCENPRKAMELIRELSDRTKRPLIVHASRTSLPLEEILSFMKEGDIFAHSFADKLPGLLDDGGHVKECAWKARERGVFFDLSHGKSNFAFDVAKKAVQQGFLTDAISTDLHKGSLENVTSLALTMSKMLACGLSLEKVLQQVTTEAVRMLGISDKVTKIAEGAFADVTIFEVQDGEFPLKDSDGKSVMGSKLIKPYCTILGQEIYPAEKVSLNCKCQ